MTVLGHCTNVQLGCRVVRGGWYPGGMVDAAMVGWWMVTVSPTDTDTTGWHGGAGVCQSRFRGLWHARAQSIPQCQAFWKPITKEPDSSPLPELSRLWLWLGQAPWAVLATPEQFHNFTWQLYKVKKAQKSCIQFKSKTWHWQVNKTFCWWTLLLQIVKGNVLSLILPEKSLSR